MKIKPSVGKGLSKRPPILNETHKRFEILHLERNRVVVVIYFNLTMRLIAET